jgi:coenzyme F420 hydrogenase subunit beta
MTLSATHASPALSRVARGDLCAGCGICAGLAPGKITMVAQPPGYLRPVQTEALDARQEAMIAAICPGLGQTVEAAGRPDSPLWGPYVAMRTGWASDPAVRHAGSSGGVLTALLGHLVAEGRVDAVLQTAADPVFPIGNATVITTDAAAILAAAGSRYAPSSPLSDLAGRMAEERRLAFVGKPCDAAALRALAGRDPAVARSFPVILSFFCAGVPSHAGGRKVLEALDTDLDHTARFRFRGDGWPGEAVAILKDGSRRAMSYHDSWGGILSKHVQHRCKICADGTGAAADIVCADAWETDAQGYPLFSDRPGVSLIVARTALGAEILGRAKALGIIQTQDFDVARLAAIQPGQRERRRALAARLAALKLLGRPVPDYRGLKILEAARQNGAGHLLRNFLGTLRRGLKPKA